MCTAFAPCQCWVSNRKVDNNNAQYYAVSFVRVYRETLRQSNVLKCLIQDDGANLLRVDLTLVHSQLLILIYYMQSTLRR